MIDFRFPKAAVLELTYKCNHNCLFCSCPWYNENVAYQKGKELDLDLWIKAIDRLYSVGVQNFTISGGEALLKDCCEDIIAYIYHKKNMYGDKSPIVLISNGRSMSEKYMQMFKRYNVQLSMSLPGINAFERHTGVDNSENVLFWFSKAKEYGLNTTANITVTKLNYDELYETISMALLAGADQILLNRFLPGGRGLKYKEELMLTNDQLRCMLDTAEQVLSIGNRYGSVGTEMPICIIDDINKYEHLSIGTHCAAAKEFFVVGPSGEIRVCNHSPKVVGNIYVDDIITDRSYWNLFANSDYKPEVCAKCKFYRNCDCGCREVAHIETNDPCKPEECVIEELNMQK